MNRRYWIFGLVTGVVVGFTVAFVMTLLDWRLNPGGDFHNANGTDWTVVVETAVSWFVPMSVLAGSFALLILFVLARLR